MSQHQVNTTDNCNCTCELTLIYISRCKLVGLDTFSAVGDASSLSEVAFVGGKFGFLSPIQYALAGISG